MQDCIKIFISHLYEAQRVSGDTPPIIRSLKLHQQPLVFHKWRVVRRVVAGHCQVEYEKVHCCIRIFNLHLYKAQRVSGDTPPIIRSLKLHQQPLVFHTWRDVRRVVAGHSQVEYKKVHCSIRIFISYSYKAQHVSGDTPSIIRNLKLHQQPLVFHTCRDVGRVVAGHCQVEYDKLQCTFSYST